MSAPTADQIREALERVLRHLGEMPHDWPSRELFRAYSDAEELLRPDEFRARFMAGDPAGAKPRICRDKDVDGWYCRDCDATFTYDPATHKCQPREVTRVGVRG